MARRLYDIAAENYYRERRKKAGGKEKEQKVEERPKANTTKEISAEKPPIRRQSPSQMMQMASTSEAIKSYHQRKQEERETPAYEDSVDMLKSQLTGGSAIGPQDRRASIQLIAEKNQQRERRKFAEELEKNYGWKRVGNEVIYATPLSPLPDPDKVYTMPDGTRMAVRGTKATAPGSFDIAPSEYVGTMQSFDRFDQLKEKGAPKSAGMDAVESEEGKRFLNKWFPEKAGALPTEDEVRAKYAQLDPWQQDSYWMEWTANEAALAPLMTQEVETAAYQREMDEAQAARDEALKLLGAGADKLATGRTADYYERYGNEYRAMDGNTGETPYLRYGSMDGIDLETAKRYSASPYIGRGQGYDLQRWAMTNPQQREHYELLLRVYGQEEADNYMLSLQGELNEKLAQEETALAQQYADEHPFLSNLETLVTAPVRGAVALEGMAQEYLGGKQMDNYDPRLNMTRRTEAIRGQTAQNIGGGAGGFLYQTLMSIGDNVANMALMGGLGSTAVGMSMFGSSFASAFNDAVDRTGSHDQGMLAGILSGTAEMLFEKYSIEGFFDLMNKGQGGRAVLDVLKQMGTEASEEGATAIANEIADRMVMGEKSNYETNVANKMAQGVPEEEARRAANMEAAKEIGLSALGGAISGGVMGGAGVGINRLTGANAQTAQEEVKPQEVQVQQPAEPVRVEREITGRQPAQETQAEPQAVQTVQKPVRVEREITGKRPAAASEVLQQEAQSEKDGAMEAPAEQHAQMPSRAEKGKALRVEREVTVRRNGIAQDMSITGVEDVRNGNVFLRAQTADGDTEIVSAGDVEFADPVQQELMSYKGVNRMDAVGVRGYLDGYYESIATPQQYAQAFESAYEDGRAGIDYEKMLQMDVMARRYLKGEVRQDAWAAGDRANLMNARGTKFQKIVTEALNKASGGKIRFVDEDIAENGYYDPKTGEIVISRNADRGAYAYIAVHELGHKLKVENAEAWTSFQTLVEDALLVNGVDIDERIAHTKELYKGRGQNLTTEEALEEVICNSAAAILQDEKIVKDMVAKDRTLMERVADFLREFVDNLARTIREAGEGMRELGSWKQLDALKGDHENLQKIYQSLMSALEGTKENHSAGDGGMVKESVSETFEAEYDAWAKEKKMGQTIRVGTTADVLVGLGAKKQNVIMRSEDIVHALRHDGMTDNIMKQIPQMMENPIIVMKSGQLGDKNNHQASRVVMYGNVNDENGIPVIAVLELRERMKGGQILDMQLVKNAYGKNNRLDVQIQKSEILYLNPDKKRTNRWLHSLGLQLPSDTTNYGSIGSISYPSGYVKMDGVRYSDLTNGTIKRKMSLKEDTEGNTLTAEQQEYFANSKVRDENGNLKVMHHGTANDFTVFNPMLQGGKNGVAEGYGIYFTDTASITDTYGGKRLSGYLNITHPARSTEKTIRPNVLAKLIQATCEAEAEKWVADGDYDNKADALKDTWVSNYEYTYDSPMSTVYRKVASSIITGEDSDMGIVQEVMAGTAVRSYEDAYQFYDILKETTGIDGFITEWDNDENPGKKVQIALAFDSNQFKNLDNKAPTENPDIRYSVRETSEAVQEELKQTADAFEHVRYAHRITAAEADVLAGRMLKEANSTYDRAELAEEIGQIYNYIENAETVDMDHVDDMQTELMARVMDKSRVLDEEHEQMVDPVREYLKGTRIRLTEAQREEAISISGSYGAYRRELMGRVKLVSKGGTELDVAWEELHDILPEWFPEDTPEGDMPGMLLEVKDAIKPVYNTGMNTEENASWLAGKLNEAYMSLPAVKAAARSQKGFAGSVREMRQALKRFEETSADEFGEALRLLEESRRKSKNETDREALVELRRQYDEWKAKDDDKREERFRLEVKRAQDKLRADDLAMRRVYLQVLQKGYERQRVKDNAQRRERELLNKQRARTEATVRTMLNWLDKPTDAKHVPAGLEEPLNDVLMALDFGGKNTKAATQLSERLERLATAIEGAQEGEDENRTMFLERDQQMVDELRRVVQLIKGNTEGRGVYELNGHELKDLNKWLGVVKHVLVNAGKMRGSNFDQDVQQVAAESMLEISRKKPMKDKKWITKQWENHFGVDMMDSFTFFERLGRTSTMVFDGLRKGFDQMTRCVKQAETYTQELLGGASLKNLTGRKAEKLTFELEESGRTVEMTRAQIMELYVLNRREQARGHIYGDGILIRGDEDAHAHAVTERDVVNITSVLTDEERKIADGLQKFLSKTCAEWGNETSLQLLGYEKFGEENYWPISTDPNTRNTTRLEENFAANISAIKNQGMTKQLIEGARNAIMIGDIFDSYTRHISNMAAYASYAVPLSDFTRWYNSRGLKIEIAHVMGQKGLKYINNLLMAINGTAQKADVSGLGKLAGAFSRNAKTASVGANVRVMIQQPTSYARAAMYISPKYLMAAMGRKLENAELVDKYCGIAAWKRYGFYETNIGPNLREMIVGDKSAIEKGREMAMKPAAWGDNWTLNRLWVACELETADMMPELKKGTEAYYQYVGRRMSEIVDRTQVVDSPFHRSQMMRSKNAMDQILTNFMSEPTKSYNMLMSAIYDYADNRKNPAAAKRVARAFATWSATAVLTAAAAGIVDAFRNDDDEKEFLEKYGEAVLGNSLDGLNPLGMLPGVKDVLSLLEGYEPSRLDQQSIQRIIWAQQEIQKYVNGESKQNLYGVIYKVAQALSSTLGIPVSNVMRDMNAIIQSMTGMSPTLNAEAQKGSYINQLYAAMQKGDQKKDASIRQKLRTEAGMSPKDIDTAIADKLSYDERIAAAWTAKKEGRIGDVNRTKNALAKEGFTGEMVDKAIATHGNRAEPKEKKEKDMDAQLTAKLYSYDDAMVAINAGASIADIKAMMSDMVADSTAKDPGKAVSDELQGRIKKEYQAAYEKGDTAKMNSLRLVLTESIGTKPETIEKWMKDWNEKK